MAYIENRTVHDADSHVMEMPDKILEYLEPSYREEFISEANKAVTVTRDLAAAEAKQNDPEFRASDEAELLQRKNHLALGAYRNQDRSKTLDLLGVTSQLVLLPQRSATSGSTRRTQGSRKRLRERTTG